MKNINKNKNKNKTKKWRKIGKKNQTKKKYGGNKDEELKESKGETEVERKDDHSNNKTMDKYNNDDKTTNKEEIKELLEKKHSEDIMDEILEEKKKLTEQELPGLKLTPEINLGNSEVLEKTGELAEGLTLNAIEDTGELLGVDLSNPEETSRKLDEIKEVISSPETAEKVNEIVGEAAVVGAVALEAAEPFTKPLIDKSVELAEETGNKMGKAGVNIILNTIEEIPGIGIFVGTVRSLNTAALTGLSALDATNEVIDKTSDTIKATSRNFEDLLDEKTAVLKRTGESVKAFEEPLKKIPSISSIHNIPNNNKVPTGGAISKKNSKKYKGKTKRVRFSL
jgi:hypothetical protein